MKKISVVTFGCRFNRAESEKIEKELDGHFQIQNKEMADIYLINSCGVTGAAILNVKRAILKIKQNNLSSKILVFGCASGELKLMNLPVDVYITEEQKEELSKRIIQEYGEDNKKVFNKHKKIEQSN